MTIENGETQNSKKRTGVQLSEREVSHVIIVLLVGAICIFLAGYFLGKKRMFEEVASIDEMQFADKITAALDSIGKAGCDDADSVGGGDDDDDESDQATTPSPAAQKTVAQSSQPAPASTSSPERQLTGGVASGATTTAGVTPTAASVSAALATGLPGTSALAGTQVPALTNGESGLRTHVGRVPRAYAKLCGFGALAPAEAYVQRVKKYGVSAKVESHSSYTAGGRPEHPAREVIWYQVVTDVMPKSALAVIVQSLKKKDRLRNVVVVDSPERSE
jgi:hypothetical protein